MGTEVPPPPPKQKGGAAEGKKAKAEGQPDAIEKLMEKLSAEKILRLVLLLGMVLILVGSIIVIGDNALLSNATKLAQILVALAAAGIALVFFAASTNRVLIPVVRVGMALAGAFVLNGLLIVVF
jgi:hypothetical protein